MTDCVVSYNANRPNVDPYAPSVCFWPTLRAARGATQLVGDQVPLAVHLPPSATVRGRAPITVESLAPASRRIWQISGFDPRFYALSCLLWLQRLPLPLRFESHESA